MLINNKLKQYFKQDENHVHHIYSIVVLLFFLVLSSGILYKYLGEIEKKTKQDKKIAEYYKKNEINKVKLALKKKTEKINKLKFIKSLDLKTDNSITKFVNSEVSFNNKGYVPENLEEVGSDYVYDSKGGRQIVRKITNKNLQKLAKEFKKEFGVKLKVVSAYRSYAYQKGIKDRGCPDNLCAKAGYSEHQSGLAIDIFEASTQYDWNNDGNLKKYYKWFNKNAHKYGFHNTYQKGLEIDGYEIEPWHWRYLGVELATYLKENNMTIAEFYNNKNIK